MARKRKVEQSPPSGFDQINNIPQDAKAIESASSRRKKSAATRIGRACDRCQHRKLACDPAPEGCPTCVRVDAWCTATDPLTGNPTYRGEFEYLERTVAKQRALIQQLISRLQLLGEDVEPYQDDDPGTKQYLAWTQVKAAGDTRPWDRDERQPSAAYATGPQQVQNGGGVFYSTNGVSGTDSPSLLHSNQIAISLPDLRTGLRGENYLGVSANNPSSSSNQGSKINVLGWELNITGFTPGDPEQASQSFHAGHSYDRSYQSLIASTFGINSKIDDVRLPSREEALRHAYGYLYVINCFVPVLHGPSFLALLARFYDEPDFKPTAAEKVMVHIVFATMFYQDANRNWEDHSRQSGLHAASDMHYHYSLGFFGQLMGGYTLQDIQALTMICAHVRTFPKPEASWLVTSIAFSKAIEMGLHKGVKAGTIAARQKSQLEIEMRKRVFWSLNVIHITVSGKLGRPMPIREEDLDVGYPLAVDDNLLSEAGLDSSKPGKCGFLAGIEAFKVEPIFMNLYRNIYAAKRSAKDYTQFVANAEKQINTWKEQWPSELHENSALNDMFTGYLHLWYNEFRLLLHHPSLSLSKSVQVNDTNLRACLDASHDMLKCVTELQRLKALDTTWQSCAVFILAIQTALYGHGHLKNELTAEKVEVLKSEMEQWLGIMGDIGGMLGTGQRFLNAIREQINIGLSQLEKQLSVKNAMLTTPNLRKSSIPSNSDTRTMQGGLLPGSTFQDVNGYGPYSEAGPLNGFERSNGLPPSGPDDGAHSVYPNMAGYAYPEPSHAQYPTTTAITSNYTASPYPVNLATQALSSAYQSQMSSGATVVPNSMYHTAAGSFPMNNSYGPDSQSWIQYTQTIPSVDYNPASALLQLGGRTEQVVRGNEGRRSDAGGAYDASAMSGGGGQMWPFNIVDHNPDAT